MAQELSDTEVFGGAQAAPAAPPGPSLMSDAEVFGKPQELSDEDVFGKPKSPGILEYGKQFAKQIGIGGIEAAIPMYLRGVGQQVPLPGEMESIVAPTVAPGTMPPPPQPPPVDLRTLPSYQTAEQISEMIGSNVPDPILHPVITDIARGLGSVATSIVTSPVGGPIMAGRGEAAQMAVQAGATPEQQARAQNLGSAPGSTDFLDMLLISTGGTGRALGLIKRVGLKVLEGFFIEGGQEALQQGIQNLIAKGVYDPNKDLLQDVPYNFFIGGVVGGAVRGVGGVRRPEATAAAPTEAGIGAAGAGIVEEPPPPAGPAAGPVPRPPTPSDIAAAMTGIVEPPVAGFPVSYIFGSGIELQNAGPVETNAPGPIQVPMRGAEQLQVQPQAEPIAPGPVPPPRSLADIIPPIGRGAPVQVPVGGAPIGVTMTVNPIHSTTLGDILPNITATHLQDKPIPSMILEVLKQKLAAFAPSMPVHFIMPSDMERAAGPRAGGSYFPYNGPILIRSDQVTDQEGGTHTILHEATHAVTSNIMLKDPLVAERAKTLLFVARLRHPDPQSVYGFKNEREFIAEAFTSTEMQEFLLKHQADQDVMKALGLTGRPVTLWQAFVEWVRQVLGMPKTRDSYTLLEATLRVGTDIMMAQQRHIQRMQRQFNAVEPELQAIARQPETRPVYDMMSGLRDYIPRNAEPELLRQAGYADKSSRFYRYMLHAFQLGELNPRNRIYQGYLEDVRARSVVESKWVDGAMKVLKDWEGVGLEQAQAVTSFLDDITNMVYRTQKEVAAGVGRKPTQQEFQTLVRKHKLNAEGLKVVQKINTIFDGFLTDSAQLAMNEAFKITDPIQRAKAVDAVNARVRNLRSVPYFPFMRYGRHVVLVRNAKGVVVHREHFERRGFKSAEAFQREAIARLEKVFSAPQFKVELDVMSESAAPMVGMPGPLLDAMAQKLSLTAAQRKALEQLQFEMSPAQSFRHRFQNKSYVKGYSQDFQRSFGQYFFHGAKWLSKTQFADSMRQRVRDMEASAKALPVGEANKRFALRDFMQDHLDNNVLDPKQDFLAFKAGLVFWTLGFMPVSAAVNMSQVPMVSLPFLSGKFGIAAPKALLKAIADGRNYYREGSLANMTTAKAKALAYGIETGRLDQTLAAELAAWAQGGNLGLYRGRGFRGNTARTIHGGMQKAMWMFSIAEKWNRRITFEAARELALANPNNKFAKEALTHYTEELIGMIKAGWPRHEAEAALVAGHVVDQTQFMATPESRPRVMRGKLGTLLLYKRFVQGLLFLTLNNKKDFAPLFIPMMMLMAGLGGVPGYDELKDIAKLLAYRMFGKDFDLDRELRKLIRSMMDEQWAPDLIMHGTARIGFGAPWLLNALGNTVGLPPMAPTVDLSASVGIGQISPMRLSPLFGPQGMTDAKGQFGEQAASAGGVGGQVAFNFYKALANKDEPGDFKRWELAMPRILKSLSHSYRAYSEGMERGRGGVAIIRYDTRDPEHLGEILGMAMGFQPERLTAKQELLRAQFDAEKFFNVGRQMILEQWDSALRAGKGPKEMEKMRDATREFNSSLPSWARGKAISSDTVLKSLQARARTRTMEEAGLAAQRGNVPIVREMQGLYPRAVIDVRKVK